MEMTKDLCIVRKDSEKTQKCESEIIRRKRDH